MSGILLILLLLGFFIWRKSENSKSSSRTISIESEGLDDGWYEESRKEDIRFSETTFLDEEKL